MKNLVKTLLAVVLLLLGTTVFSQAREFTKWESMELYLQDCDVQVEVFYEELDETHYNVLYIDKTSTNEEDVIDKITTILILWNYSLDENEKNIDDIGLNDLQYIVPDPENRAEFLADITFFHLWLHKLFDLTPPEERLKMLLDFLEKYKRSRLPKIQTKETGLAHIYQ